MSKKNKKTCPRCHSELECSADEEGPCWCFGLAVKKIDKKDAYETCLCAACLSELPDKK